MQMTPHPAFDLGRRFKMKTVGLLFCAVLLGSVVASAQTLSSDSLPPDIIVLEKNWGLHVRNSLLDTDPFSANTEFNNALRAQRENDIRNAVRARGSESREPPPPRVIKNQNSSLYPAATYLYQVKIKNAGTKTILAVDWGYTFTDPETQEELGRHRYSNKVKIRPGKNSGLNGRTANPPTQIVSSKNAGKDVSRKLSEQVVIYRIEYDDGTIWKAPIN
jgi:hypothetical protein